MDLKISYAAWQPCRASLDMLNTNYNDARHNKVMYETAQMKMVLHWGLT